jgi:DNA-directed RNA polymerase specialized sigma24 family protein
MRDRAARPVHWTLTASAFDHLLRALDADRDRAGERYELIRRKLLKFFECRASPNPEDDADETLSRVARRLEAGERIENLPAYFYGVARFVLLEASRERHREVAAVEEATHLPDRAEEPADDRRLACLEQCLSALPSASRELLTSYYQEGEQGKIRRRQELAEKQGIPMNALRIRVHRLRTNVESCTRGCLSRSRV